MVLGLQVSLSYGSVGELEVEVYVLMVGVPGQAA